MLKISPETSVSISKDAEVTTDVVDATLPVELDLGALKQVSGAGPRSSGSSSTESPDRAISGPYGGWS